jgi:hypothetical protein
MVEKIDINEFNENGESEKDNEVVLKKEIESLSIEIKEIVVNNEALENLRDLLDEEKKKDLETDYQKVKDYIEGRLPDHFSKN